jgi:hypothetical protein
MAGQLAALALQPVLVAADSALRENGGFATAIIDDGYLLGPPKAKLGVSRGSRRGGSDRPSELPTATADPAAGYLGGGWAASRVSIRHAQRFIQRSVPKSAAVTVGEF